MTYNEKCNFIAERIMEGREYAFINDNLVNLPSPQRTGTYTQQRTYALLKAREIVDNLKTLTA